MECQVYKLNLRTDAFPGDYSLGCRTFPAPSWAPCRRVSTQPANAGLKQTPSLSSTTVLKWEHLLSNSTMWLPRHTWHEKELELKAFGGLEKHTRSYFTKYLCFSFFIGNFFFLLFVDVMTGMYRIHESVFFSFLFLQTFSLGCFLHQRTLQNNFLHVCLVFYVSKYVSWHPV